MAIEKPKIYSVSRVNALIKVALQENLPSRLTVTGEISDWKLHHSGHCYFSLKDEDSKLPCVMWKSNFAKTKFAPENGMAVLATGYIDVYTPQGKYQLYVEKLQPAGVGALQMAFEQMVKKLQAEGLFDDAHKKPLPRYPQRIGILTSPTGAAVEDIKDSIHNRWPCVKLYLCPVPVQGEGAAEKIAAALYDINKKNKQLKLDLLIVGRGGGSLEDLWAFNEEILARAIYNSKIPVISAVGHEIDTTIADLVADARASTPTKAGITAVPDISEVLAHLANIQSRLKTNAQTTLELARRRLQTILAAAVFRNPLLPVRNSQQQLDELQVKLADSLKQLLHDARDKLHAAFSQVIKIEPHRLLKNKAILLNNLANKTNAAVKNIINKNRMQLTAQDNRLTALNPKSVLHRGYSITTNKKTGLVVRAPHDVQLDDLLRTELADENFIESKVTKKQNRPT